MARAQFTVAGHRRSAERQSSGRSPKKTIVEASPHAVERYKLDFASRVTIKSFLGIYVPGIALLIFLAYWSISALSATVIFLGGYLSWTLFEYWVHRSVLHWEPRQRFLARLHWMGHGHHHADPRDPLRLMFPLIFSIPILLGMVGIFVTVIGPQSGWAFSAGWVSGYVLMDTIHYMIHQGRAANRVGRRLHELHMRHHFQEGSHGFGTASPWWDFIFGTTHVRAAVRNSKRRNPAVGI
jgi:dihydroceramide fatty acyl 2-hydroxylase